MPKCEKCDNSQPNFNYSDKDFGIRCKKHREEGMINIIRPQCDHIDKEGEECQENAYYGYSDNMFKIKCEKHKEKGMIEKRNQRCHYINPENGEQCETKSSYKITENYTATRCGKHKNQNMICSEKRICNYIFPDGKKCNTHAIYGYEKDNKRIRCSSHILEGMEDLLNNKCEFIDDVTHEKCKLLASYGYEEDNKRIRCSGHKLKNMEDLSCKKCEECKTIASFGYEKDGIKRMCAKHKLKDMINLHKNYCEFDGCGKIAYYKYESDRKNRFCFSHKLSGMITSNNRSCKECNVSASYGELFSDKIHCKAHKSPNEFLYNFPICEEQDCNEYAYYTNDKSNYPHRCEKHKLDDDVNLIEEPCSKCNLTFILNKSTGLCSYCNAFEIEKIHKAKETATIKYLIENGIQFDSLDKKVEHGCSKYRPDSVVDYQYFMVIGEVDENQHRSYSNECEIARMIQIYQDFGGIPVISVRYNPDNYTDKNGVIIKPNPKYRLNVLLETLKRIELLKKQFEKGKGFNGLYVCYLFYDGYEEPKLEKIDVLGYVKSNNLNK
jgi:hypothetical protein